jgi:glycosyltransferase 2 family protein
MRRVETFIILLALGFYFWFLRRFGLNDVLGYIRLAGWGLLLTIALESVARFANTIGWRVTIENYPRALGIGELFVARIAGEAVDYVTPSAQLGGQFVMALMVRRKLAMAAGLATVVVAALAEAVGQIGFISGALLAALPYEARLHHLLWPVMAGLTLAVGLAGAFLFIQMKRPFSHLWKMAARFDLPQASDPEVVAAAADADTLLIDFYQRHRLRLAASCLCYLMAWSMGPLEIFIYLRLLHQHASWTVALAVEALGLLTERATFLIPAKLVSQEGGKALILSLLGYPPNVGFAIGFIRRLKEMVWVMFGLCSLALHRMITEGETRMITAESKGVIKIHGAQRGETL